MTTKKDDLIVDEMSQTIVNTVENMVTAHGAANLNVRKVLIELGITNRVFYNRFHNIDEVLSIVYKNTVQKIHECIADFDPNKDFYEQAVNFVASTLEMSYDTKMKFNQYVFESDSISTANYQWWMGEIKKLLNFAVENGLMREIDSDKVSYAIWCFCRGFNADAVARGLPRDEAVESFKYSFGIFLDGLKNK